MFEYLHPIYYVPLLITVVSLQKYGVLDFEKLKDLFKPWKDIFDFLGNISRWIQLYNNLIANKQLLEERNIRLRTKLSDMRKEVEDKEFQTGRRRRSEVDHWLSSTETKCNEVETFLQQMAFGTIHYWKFIYLAWLGIIVEKKIQVVDDLFRSGKFSEVLLPFTDRFDLLTTQLVGNAATKNIRKILGWLENGVTKIGVHGIKGIGKTEVMKHIHNQLSQNGDLYVYMIQVGENQKAYELQGAIAEEVGIVLQEDNEQKRAAVLYRALQQKNFVLILDGLRKHLSEVEVGVPLDRTRGKMIITSRSRDVCRITGCQSNIIAVDPLLDDEALFLFRKTVEIVLDFGSPKEDLARRIVEQCRGVPRKIIDTAVKLRGIEEISEWEETLHDMLAGPGDDDQ